MGELDITNNIKDQQFNFLKELLKICAQFTEHKFLCTEDV